jgi:glycosyltransferase involved in cell wall biosynthesis
MENRLKRKKDNIILILMPYYNRPKDVLLALSSIKKQSYKNWRLAFVDDGSDEPGKDIVRSFFEEKDLDKVTFYNTGDTKEIKQKRRLDNLHKRGSENINFGSFFVPYFNKAMESIDFDIALFLSDDDFLNNNYLNQLNNYYNMYPDIIYSFCNIILYEQINENETLYSTNSNRFTWKEAIHPHYNLDGSQVSWRSKCFKDGCRFSEEYLGYWDAEWYGTLQIKYGKCEYNKLIGQYKRFQSAFFYEPKKWYLNQ